MEGNLAVGEDISVKIHSVVTNKVQPNSHYNQYQNQPNKELAMFTEQELQRPNCHGQVDLEGQILSY